MSYDMRECSLNDLLMVSFFSVLRSVRPQVIHRSRRHRVAGQPRGEVPDARRRISAGRDGDAQIVAADGRLEKRAFKHLIPLQAPHDRTEFTHSTKHPSTNQQTANNA